jgi:hypothetical protein
VLDIRTLATGCGRSSVRLNTPVKEWPGDCRKGLRREGTHNAVGDEE